MQTSNANYDHYLFSITYFDSSESNSIDLIVEEVLRMLASIPFHAHTSNPEKINQLPGNGNTSSQVTLVTDHAKAQEVEVIPTQPKNILPLPYYGYGPRPRDDSLPFTTKASRPGTSNLKVKETLDKSPKLGCTVNHAEGSRPEILSIGRSVDEIMANYLLITLQEISELGKDR